MATAKPRRMYRDGPNRTRPRRHRLRNGLAALAVVTALAVALFWNQLHTRAVVAASYGARIACTCRYIEGRGLKDCRKDFEPGMGLVMLSENAALHTITARVPLVAAQSASLRDGAGCVLQSWAP